MESPGNTWAELRQLVLSILERHDKNFDEIWKKFDLVVKRDDLADTRKIRLDEMNVFRKAIRDLELAFTELKATASPKTDCSDCRMSMSNRLTALEAKAGLWGAGAGILAGGAISWLLK